MDSRESSLLVENYKLLIESTKVDQEFLNILKVKNVLNDEDINKIQKGKNNKGQAIFLYSELMFREGFLEPLKSAFRQTRQEMLLKIVDSQIFCNFEDENARIGTGSCGTVVIRGKFAETAVAVKIIYSNFPNDTLGEIAKMTNMIPHKNVVKMHYSEFSYTKKGHMLALDLCEGNLNDWMDSKKFPFVISAKDILRQCAQGLAHIHKLDIVHADLKPANILLHFDQDTRSGCIKIADFGMSKEIQPDRDCVTITSIVGTKRWQAPEVLKFIDEHQKIKLTKRVKITMSPATDIFALGCIYYKLVTKNQKHPFGEIDSEIYKNVMENNPMINENDCDTGFKQNGSVPLMIKMVAFNEDCRPPASHIIFHPIFWNELQSLKFLIEIGNISKDKNTLSSSDILDIETKFMSSAYYNYIKENGWTAVLCTIVSDYLIKKATKIKTSQETEWEALKILLQNFSQSRMEELVTPPCCIKDPERSIFGLLYIITMLWDNFNELPQTVRNAMGDTPVKFMNYWTQRFPWLIYFIWLNFYNFKFRPIMFYFNESNYDFTK